MPDKIKIRTINTDTYAWAHWPEIDNKTKSLRVRMDELSSEDDSVMRENFDATRWLTFKEALKDPRIAAQAQRVYEDMRHICLVMMQDHFTPPNTPEEEEPNVT